MLSVSGKPKLGALTKKVGFFIREENYDELK
jgi:hypothetical protein